MSNNQQPGKFPPQEIQPRDDKAQRQHSQQQTEQQAQQRQHNQQQTEQQEQQRQQGQQQWDQQEDGRNRKPGQPENTQRKDPSQPR